MISTIANFLSHHLVVLLAAVVVPLKFLVLRFCNDSEGQSAAVLAIPEDLNYVALGLILGDMSLSGGAFRNHFHGDQHEPVEMLVTIGIGIIVAILIHVLAMWGNDQFNKFRAAGRVRSKNAEQGVPKQIELPITKVDENVMMLQAQYVVIFSLCYAAQLLIVIRWIGWIAGIISNSQPSSASY
jgi:hypothetical protein